MTLTDEELEQLRQAWERTNDAHDVEALVSTSDAYIFALEAEVERLTGFGGAAFNAGFEERQRAERAERERDDVLDEVRLRRRELEAGYAVQKRLREERDALKCCGNCRHSDDPGDGGLWCCVGGTATNPVGCGNPCYHQPSRWRRRPHDPDR